MRRTMLMLITFGSVMWINNAQCADDDIVFAPKNFADTDLAVGISGTLTGDGLAYKNNTRSIFCIKDRGECLVASIEQIGDHQIGRLDYVYVLPITRWLRWKLLQLKSLAIGVA
jgi:hypothetical protein